MEGFHNPNVTSNDAQQITETGSTLANTLKKRIQSGSDEPESSPITQDLLKTDFAHS